MKIHPLVHCPGCGGEAAVPVGLGGRYELRRCTTCELVYAPEYGDPSEIYVEGYLTGGTDFGLDVFHPIFQEFLHYAAGRRLEVVERLRGGPGRLLDVGCGSGEVLATARDRGWEVAGAEPVEQSAQIARERGLDVRTALVQDAGFEEGAWDVVTAFHVLEHLTDAIAFLQLMARYAKPGGLVVVEVPNWASYDRRRKGADWPGVRQYEHVAHYTPATVRGTMQRAGLEPALVRSMGFAWERQSLHERLDDLARVGWGRALRRLGRDQERDGKVERMPGPILHRALLGVQSLYDRRGRGQVVLGLARTPRRPA